MASIFGDLTVPGVNMPVVGQAATGVIAPLATYQANREEKAERTTLLKLQMEREEKKQLQDAKMKVVDTYSKLAEKVPDENGQRQLWNGLIQYMTPELKQELGTEPPGFVKAKKDLTIIPQGAKAVDSSGNVVVEGEPKEQSFEKEAYAEWKNDNPGGTRMQFLKEKKQEMSIHVPSFQEMSYSDWKRRPGNEPKDRADYIRFVEDERNKAKGGGIELSPEAVEIEGVKFATTGKMPSMGMASSPVRLQIINSAARYLKDQGIDPKSVPAVQAEFAAVSQAFKSVKTPLANFKAFEDALIKNADYALELSKDNYRTQIPPVNVVMNAIKTKTGDPNIVKFGAAIYAAAMEYEKIRTAGTNITSAELSVGAQQKAEEIMNKAQTHKQLEGVIEAMKVDAGNVVGARTEQLTVLKNEMSRLNDTFRKSKDEKPPVKQEAPPAAIEYLRKNPQFKNEFKTKYGYLPEGL